MINSVEDIAKLLVSGETDWRKYGFVNVKTKGDLTLFNYTPEATYEGSWNFFETVSRGLIIDNKFGEIVARPFDKFFNYGEHNKTSTAKIREVKEKMDGSLGILYRVSNETPMYRIATRGSFDGEQATWATKYLNHRYNLRELSSDLTLLFEIIYPENRVVIDYRFSDLMLLAARNRFTGEYLSSEELGILADVFKFSMPMTYRFNSVEEIINNTKDLYLNQEGYVVEFEDNQRFKFKGAEYLRIHKLISNLSFRNTVPIVQFGLVEETRETIPDEFLTEFNNWVWEIESTVNKIYENCIKAYDVAINNIPKDNKKDFAIYVQRHFKELAPMLFAMWDKKEIVSIIYKVAFGNIYVDGKKKEEK